MWSAEHAECRHSGKWRCCNTVRSQQLGREKSPGPVSCLATKQSRPGASSSLLFHRSLKGAGHACLLGLSRGLLFVFLFHQVTVEACMNKACIQTSQCFKWKFEIIPSVFPQLQPAAEQIRKWSWQMNFSKRSWEDSYEERSLLDRWSKYLCCEITAGATDLGSGEPGLAIRASGLIERHEKSVIETKRKLSFPQHQTLASRRNGRKRDRINHVYLIDTFINTESHPNSVFILLW